jgi:hypothetical protein
MIESLPKDVIIKIMQKFDMDTRIKAGIVGKLNVPQSLVDKISKAYRRYVDSSLKKV